MGVLGACPRCGDLALDGDVEPACPRCHGRFAERDVAEDLVQRYVGVDLATARELSEHFAGKRLLCPGCNASMTPVQLRSVQLDLCPGCGGIWFDLGELQRLSQGDREEPALHALAERDAARAQGRAVLEQKRAELERRSSSSVKMNPRYPWIAGFTGALAVAVGAYVGSPGGFSWEALLLTLLYFAPTLASPHVMRLHVCWAANAMLGYTCVGWFAAYGWPLLGERYIGKSSDERLRLERVGGPLSGGRRR